MKVLVLSPPLGSVGGIQRYTATLLRALKDELGDESVVCIAVPDALREEPNGRLSARWKLTFALRVMRQAARWKPDLIICTHLGLGPAAGLVANAGLRYWIVLHGIEAWARLPYGKQRALRRANRVLVTSAFNQVQVVRQQRIDPKRISRLPCALDDTLLNLKPATIESRQQLPDGQPVVLTVARMLSSEKYKGHDVVLRALPSVLSRIPNLTYIVVGDGDDRPRLERLAKDLAIEQHVWFTGEVSDPELTAIYRRSDVFVLPARTVLDDHAPKGEGFGIVFLEAMGFDKPVVGPNYGAPAELVRHGENGLLVDPEDPASVAEALVQLLASPERAQEMGKTGGDWVRAHYSYGCFRERLSAVLNS